MIKSKNMDLISGLVGIGGLLVAALSLWLGYKDRSAMHRQVIYQKQIDAYSDIIISLSSFVKKAAELLPEKYEQLEDKARQALMIGSSEELLQFEITFNKNIIFISDDVAEKVVDFYTFWEDITNPTNRPSHLNRSHSSNPKNDLAIAYTNVIKTSREALGIGHLSKEILNIVGDRKG